MYLDMHFTNTRRGFYFFSERAWMKDGGRWVVVGWWLVGGLVGVCVKGSGGKI